MIEVTLLALGIDLARKRIGPTVIVPVIHMETQREDIRTPRQFTQQLVGARTGRAALGGEQFHDRQLVLCDGLRRNTQ